MYIGLIIFPYQNFDFFEHMQVLYTFGTKMLIVFEYMQILVLFLIKIFVDF